jgi:lysozyme
MRSITCVACTGIALALIGCVAAPPTGVVDEAQMVCAKGPTVKGIDVSHYDGAIDWGKVKAAGIGFAIMKATESTDFIDPEFAANWKYAQQNGVVRGGYHFLRPEVDGAMQADYFLATMGPSLPGDLPPTLDLEVTDNLSGAAVAKSALAWLAEIEAKTGRVPIVYTSATFMSSIGNPSGFDKYTLWVAHWTTQCPNLPPEWADWQFWQNADNGTVDGIAGKASVDTDEFNGTLASLQGFAGAPDGGATDGGIGDGGATRDGGSTRDLGGGGEGEHDGGVTPLRRSGCELGAGARVPGDASVACFAFILVALFRRRAR